MNVRSVEAQTYIFSINIKRNVRGIYFIIIFVLNLKTNEKILEQVSFDHSSYISSVRNYSNSYLLGNQWRMVTIIITFIIFASLTGVKDALRQREQQARAIGSHTLANKLSTKWHAISALNYVCVATLFSFSLVGITWLLPALVALLLAIRWVLLDIAFNWTIGKPIAFIGTTSTIDKLFNGKGWLMVLVKVVLLSGLFTLYWFIR